MSTTQEFTDYILDLLAPLGEIKTKRMFSGVLLTTKEGQLGIIIDDTLYFKVTDPELQIRLKADDSEQFSYTRKDKDAPVVIKNWWSVPETYLEDESRLTTLAHEVLNQKH